MKTQQQIYNEVCMHLAQQGKQCTDSHGECQYLGPFGDKCAIGVLLASDEDRVAMDRYTVSAKAIDDAVLARAGIPTDSDTRVLLERLQCVHDDAAHDSATKLQKRLRAVAVKYGLEPGAEAAIESWQQADDPDPEPEPEPVPEPQRLDPKQVAASMAHTAAAGVTITINRKLPPPTDDEAGVWHGPDGSAATLAAAALVLTVLILALTSC
jgi:hypothetical protein